jgi:hypothetical protein
LVLGACVLLTTSDAHAYRPFDGTDGDVADLGDLEMEVGPVGYLRQVHASSLVAPALVANYGFLPGWELVVEGNGVFPIEAGSRPQLVDTGVFLKHLLRAGALQGKSGLSLATEVGVLPPTVNAEPGSGLYVGLIASQVWRELTIHFNIELMRARDGLGELFASAILEGSSRRRIRPVAELYVDTHAGVTTPSALVGFIWRASEHVSVDAATRLATTAGAPVFEVRAGFTWTIPTLRAGNR